MTDNKIWHSKDNAPILVGEILNIYKTRDNEIKTEIFNGNLDAWVGNSDYCIKWCYLVDLISLADRAEKLEQENTQLKELLLETLPAVRMFTGGNWIELRNKITEILEKK